MGEVLPVSKDAKRPKQGNPNFFLAFRQEVCDLPPPQGRGAFCKRQRAPGRGGGALATSSEGEQSVVVSSVGALEPGAPDRNLAA